MVICICVSGIIYYKTNCQFYIDNLESILLLIGETVILKSLILIILCGMYLKRIMRLLPVWRLTIVLSFLTFWFLSRKIKI